MESCNPSNDEGAKVLGTMCKIIGTNALGLGLGTWNFSLHVYCSLLFKFLYFLISCDKHIFIFASCDEHVFFAFHVDKQFFKNCLSFEMQDFFGHCLLVIMHVTSSDKHKFLPFFFVCDLIYLQKI